MSFVRPQQKAEEATAVCIVPGCETHLNGDESYCAIWGDRLLCYPHFADWHAWTYKTEREGREPTPDEWNQFVDYTKHTEAA